MNGSSSGWQQYDALHKQVAALDVDLQSSSGAAQVRIAKEKERVLERMMCVCALHGFTEAAQVCDMVRSYNMRFLKERDANTSLSSNSRIDGKSLDDGDTKLAVFDSTSSNKRKMESSGRSRLANVPPKTPDQVNDKKVAEKSGQMDRAYVQLERMTTLTGEDENICPRQNSVIITISECNPNKGGGKRTKGLRAEEKRRERSLVMVRATDSSMLRDGTILTALIAAVEKLKIRMEQVNKREYRMLEKKEQFDIGGISVDVAFAFDWRAYHRQVFCEGSTAGSVSVNDETKRESHATATVAERESGSMDNVEDRGEDSALTTYASLPQVVVDAAGTGRLKETYRQPSLVPPALLSVSATSLGSGISRSGYPINSIVGDGSAFFGTLSSQTQQLANSFQRLHQPMTDYVRESQYP